MDTTKTTPARKAPTRKVKPVEVAQDAVQQTAPATKRTSTRTTTSTKGSGVYKCGCCGRSTRDDGNGDSVNLKLCTQCFGLGGINNAVSDGDDAAQYCRTVTDLVGQLDALKAPKAQKQWGELLSKVTAAAAVSVAALVERTAPAATTARKAPTVVGSLGQAVAAAAEAGRKRPVLARNQAGELVTCCRSTARKNGWDVVQKLYKRVRKTKTAASDLI